MKHKKLLIGGGVALVTLLVLLQMGVMSSDSALFWCCLYGIIALCLISIFKHKKLFIGCEIALAVIIALWIFFIRNVDDGPFWYAIFIIALFSMPVLITLLNIFISYRVKKRLNFIAPAIGILICWRIMYNATGKLWPITMVKAYLFNGHGVQNFYILLLPSVILPLFTLLVVWSIKKIFLIVKKHINKKEL